MWEYWKNVRSLQSSHKFRRVSVSPWLVILILVLNQQSVVDVNIQSVFSFDIMLFIIGKQLLNCFSKQ